MLCRGQDKARHHSHSHSGSGNRSQNYGSVSPRRAEIMKMNNENLSNELTPVEIATNQSNQSLQSVDRGEQNFQNVKSADYGYCYGKL